MNSVMCMLIKINEMFVSDYTYYYIILCTFVPEIEKCMKIIMEITFKNNVIS